MAQVSIREYDAKRMLSAFLEHTYTGTLIQNEADFSVLAHNKKYIIKPDQLFGKRGKYGLIGVNVSADEAKNWWKDRYQTSVEIGNKTGMLHTFLVEDFIPHTDEYYVAIKTERDADIMYFSDKGGVDIEENWDTTRSLIIPIGEPYEASFFEPLSSDTRIQTFLAQLHQFFVSYGFAYLEVNPFTFDTSGNIVCLDMVAKLDSCEAFKQKHHWQNLDFPAGFGEAKTESEKYIEKLDAETGASLKLKILNPNGKIWLLTSGGGASVILADTLADMGLAHEIANYGECSGNPDRENTRAYTETLLANLIANKRHGQYVVIAGAIANFTHIDKTFSGIIDALEKYSEALRELGVTLCVRRGGINDKRGLKIIKEVCDRLNIPCHIADGNVYMTDILKTIT